MRRRLITSMVGLAVTVGAVTGTLVAASPTTSAASPPTRYYVSLGDSYSIGYQPGIGPTSGFTGYVAGKLHLQLENFGCGGATTTSILQQIGCSSPAATDAVPYPTTTQVAAADAFLTAHAGQVGLITVSIGGNDVTACAGSSDPTTCVENADVTIKTNVTTLVGDLRTAAGSDVPIIGVTYPDVILGAWVYPPGSPDQSLAKLSVSAFQLLINPTLKAAYATGSGLFADVTKATGAYIPLSKTVHLPPYGKIPKAVAKVCELTYFCSVGDIHANTKGYMLIGKVIVKVDKHRHH